MESVSDVDINTKFEEMIHILNLPYEEFIKIDDLEFNERMQNPEMAARIGVEIDRKVEEITKNIQLAREKLEKSSFYRRFIKQMEDPEIVAGIERVIATDPHHSQLQLVLYGVGRMSPWEQYKNVEQCQMQLAFAILLREKFQWVGDIEVYDPLLSQLDRRAIEELNCTCLCVDEDCKRTVDRPTLFFMPHLHIDLYENVLEANWTPGNLDKIIILGNSLNCYARVALESTVSKRIKTLRNSKHVLHEMPLPETTIRKACPDAPMGISPPTYRARYCDIDLDLVFPRAFVFLSWHFFAWNSSLDDLSLVYMTL